MTFDAEVFLDTVRQLHVEPPPSGGLGGLGYISRFTPEPDGAGDYSASPSPYELLQSAVGDLRGPDNDFAPLTSPRAVQVAEFLRAWVHDHRLAITDGRSTRSFQRTGQFGFTDTILAFLSPSLLVSNSLDVYPLPNMGTGRSPVFVHAMLGVLASSPNPELAYDALRHLAAGLRSSSVLPATRISAEGVAARAPDLPPEGANLVEQLMTNAIYSTLSRRQAGLITNGIGRRHHLRQRTPPGRPANHHRPPPRRRLRLGVRSGYCSESCRRLRATASARRENPTWRRTAWRKRL